MRGLPAIVVADATVDAKLQRILATVDSIPRGRVATYGQVACEAGLTRRARLVGRVLRDLPSGSKLPWHRVVNAAGKSSLSGSSAREHRRRLRSEGVRFRANGTVDLALFGWRARVPERHPHEKTRARASFPRKNFARAVRGSRATMRDVSRAETLCRAQNRPTSTARLAREPSCSISHDSKTNSPRST